MNFEGASSALNEEKAVLRAQMRRRLASLDADRRNAASRRLVAALAALPVWRRARVVLLFAPTETEPDLDLLWQGGLLAGKTCYYPLVCGRDLALQRVGGLEDLRPVPPWNLREPSVEADEQISINDVDVALVPGLAFDSQGGRLGRGGGYYDRLLAPRAAGRVFTVGVGFEFQRVDYLPLAAHDAKLDAVLFAEVE